MKEEKKFVTIRIESNVHKVAKTIASLEDKGLQEYLEELIRTKIKADYPDVYKKVFSK